MSRPTVAAATVLPPLLLAALGVTHPAVLTPSSAPWWRDLHLVGLVLFPLLAVGPWALVRGRGRALEVVTAVLGLVYASTYTALDVLAGVGGGHQTMVLGPGPWVAALFGIADLLVLPGVYAYLAASAVAGATTVAAARGPGRAAAVVGTLLVLVGAWSFRTSHIYWPVGVATMLVLAGGWAVLAAVVPLDAPVRSPRRRRPGPTSAAPSSA